VPWPYCIDAAFILLKLLNAVSLMLIMRSVGCRTP